MKTNLLTALFCLLLPWALFGQTHVEPVPEGEEPSPHELQPEPEVNPFLKALTMGHFNWSVASESFEDALLLDNDTFPVYLQVDDVIFYDSLELTNVTFMSGAYFSQSEFNGLMEWYFTHSHDDVAWHGCDFYGPVKFFMADWQALPDSLRKKWPSTTLLMPSLEIDDCYFDSTLLFKHMPLDGDLNISNSYLDHTSIVGSSIGQSIRFEGNFFDRLLYIENTDAEEGISFNDCVLPDTLVLSNVSTGLNSIRFDNCYLDSAKAAKDPNYRCHLMLRGTSPGDLNIEYKHFRLHVDPYLPFERNASLYEGLLNRFKALSYSDSYELLDKEYQRFVYLNEDPEHPQWLLNKLDSWWWGYGYEKGKIVRNTLLILAFFVLLNNLFLRAFLTHVYDLKDISESDSFKQNWHRLNPVLRFFWFLPTSLFVTSLIFFGLKFDLDKLAYGENLGWRRIPRLAYFFTIYLSGIFCLAYLANFILNQ